MRRAVSDTCRVPRFFTRVLPSRMPLRSHLLALVLVTLVPVLVFSAVLVVALTRHEREGVERASRETARALAVAVDQQLEGAMAALSSLALSREVQTGDWRGCYEEARALRDSHPGWQSLFLYESDGSVVFDTRVPLETKLPRAPGEEAFRRLIATGQPVVSDLTQGSVPGRPVVLVVVPVRIDGGLRFMLGASIDVQDRLHAILERQQLHDEWIATIFDRNRVIVGRTRGADRLIGTPVSPRLAARSAAASEGSYEDVTLDGIPLYAAFSRSPVTGWTVTIAIPATRVEASLRRSLFAVVGAGFAFLVLAAGAAAIVGRRRAS